MRAYKKTKKKLPSCRALKAEDIWGTILEARFFKVGIDIVFVVTNYTFCQDVALLNGALQMKVLIYPQYGKYIHSFCPPWMGWPQYFDQNNQLISSIQLF